MSVDEIVEANQRFYRAFESLDLAQMEAVWAHEGQIICVHPGWPAQAGWDAVRESWEAIFQHTDAIRFDVEDVRAEVAGDMAWVVCVERIRSRATSRASEGAVFATNVFRRAPGNGAWKLVLHHGSAFVTAHLPAGASGGSSSSPASEGSGGDSGSGNLSN